MRVVTGCIHALVFTRRGSLGLCLSTGALNCCQVRAVCCSACGVFMLFRNSKGAPQALSAESERREQQYDAVVSMQALQPPFIFDFC